MQVLFQKISIILMVCTVLAGCGKDKDQDKVTFDRSAFRRHYAAEIINPSVRQLYDEVRILDSLVGSWQQMVSSQQI